jgi:2,3-bisphosphoglycerate-independent phosphoglycerate mutase
MKGFMLIIDGLGDLPVVSLGGLTPLEAANTPVMDRLATTGKYGLLDPIAPGETPNTHSGTGNLFGIMPDQLATLNRGPVEAAGLGLEIAPGDVVLRANFASIKPVDDGFIVEDRRAGRITEGAHELATALRNIDAGDGISVSLIPTDQHRGALVLRGPGLSSAISDTDPGNQEMPARLLECMPRNPGGERTAAVINRFIRLSYEHLRDHPLNRKRIEAGFPPANGIITRGAGGVPKLEGMMADMGISVSLVAGCNTVRGLARLFGFNVVEDDRFTGALDTDLDAKIATALCLLDQHDLVYVHVKAPDICAHDKNPEAKRLFLEKIDAALAPLEGLPIAIAIATDHTTDSNSGFHTADPVPALLNYPGADTEGHTVNFGETACLRGNLARTSSHDFLLDFLKAMGVLI